MYLQLHVTIYNYTNITADTVIEFAHIAILQCSGIQNHLFHFKYLTHSQKLKNYKNTLILKNTN